MSFYKRYELARLIQEDEAKTFSAVEIATGRPLLLHMLTPSPKLSGKAVDEIVRRAEHHPEVIEVGEFAGSYYIATEPVAGFQSFRDWVDSLPPLTPVRLLPELRIVPPPARTPSAAVLKVEPVPVPTPAPPGPPRPEQGEFTRFFGGGEVLATPPQKPLPNSTEVGEFTRMFGLADVGLESQAKPAALPESGEFTRFFGNPAPAGKALRDQGIGEFTPIFEPLLTEPVDAPPTPELNEQQPPWQEVIRNEHPSALPNGLDDSTGAYTRFFGSAIPGEPIDIQAEQARQAGIVEPNQKPFRQASDFTRVFGPGMNELAPSPPVVPDYPPSPEGTAVTRLFATPAKKPVVAAPVIAAPDEASADDYMRVVGKSAEAAPMVAAAQPVAALAPVKKDPKRMILIGVFVVLGVMLLALILFLVFSRKH